MSNSLRFIKQVNATSSVNEISLTDVFTTDYDIYKITIAFNEYDGGTNDVVDMRIRFINSSGSKITANNYSSARMTMKSEATKDEDKFTNLSYAYGVVLGGDYNSGGGVLYIYNPTNPNVYTFTSGQGASGYETTAGHKFRSTNQIGVLEQTNNIAGINFHSPSASNDFKADVRVYGIRDSL